MIIICKVLFLHIISISQMLLQNPFPLAFSCSVLHSVILLFTIAFTYSLNFNKMWKKIFSRIKMLNNPCVDAQRFLPKLFPLSYLEMAIAVYVS